MPEFFSKLFKIGKAVNINMYAQALGLHINIDSLANLEKFGKKFGHSYPVGIRLRPNIMGGGNLKVSTGHDKSKFGIPVDQLDKILSIVVQHNLFIQNLHIHTGSDIKDVDVFVKGIEVLFDIIPKFNELESIDLGGGFKVPYKFGDTETDMQLLAQKVKAAFDNHPNPNGRHLQVWFEPGKFLVSGAGYFITEVNVIKETAATTFVSVNSGFFNNINLSYKITCSTHQKFSWLKPNLQDRKSVV